MRTNLFFYAFDSQKKPGKVIGQAIRFETLELRNDGTFDATTFKILCPDHPATSSINRMKRLYRKLCEEHPDPKVQRLAQAMETALRWATEDTRGWRMKEEPMLLAQCLADDMRMPNAERSNPADSAGGKQRKDLNEN